MNKQHLVAYCLERANDFYFLSVRKRPSIFGVRAGIAPMMGYNIAVAALAAVNRPLPMSRAAALFEVARYICTVDPKVQTSPEDFSYFILANETVLSEMADAALKAHAQLVLYDKARSVSQGRGQAHKFLSRLKVAA